MRTTCNSATFVLSHSNSCAISDISCMPPGVLINRHVSQSRCEIAAACLEKIWHRIRLAIYSGEAIAADDLISAYIVAQYDCFSRHASALPIRNKSMQR